MDESQILSRLEQLRRAARGLRAIESQRKSAVLERAADLLRDREGEILAANAEDLAALKPDVTSAFKDRLTLNASRLAQMGESLRQVAALTDPVGEIVDARTLKNGLRIRRVRAPLGVIFMIFESRPNVAMESFSLGFKAGNAMILRGGKESMRSTGVLYSILQQALAAEGIPEDVLWGITDPDRALTDYLFKQKRFIDVVVPRGGDTLIEYVTKSSQIPVIKNDRGLCHAYVHEDADPRMAIEIVANAKTQRPGVCNAMETLLIHESRATELLPRIHERLSASQVEWFADTKTQQILKGKPGVHAATAESFDTEYLDYKMSCRVVSSFEEAVDHIEKHGSRHSEAIITQSADAARRFEDEVDAAAVYWNASTRFTDGFELGLGGELGISTQKLHVRGPVGLKELTSPRWVIEGTGQTRG